MSDNILQYYLLSKEIPNIPIKSGCGLIYGIMNIQTGKTYVGQTSRFKARMKAHISRSKNLPLNNAFKKYGLENFAVYVIEYDVPYDQLDELEENCIRCLDTLKNGYNLTSGGKGVGRGEGSPSYGRKASPEERAEMSKRMKGKRAGEKHPLYGKHHSPETRAKIGESQRGISKHGGKTRKRVSIANSGENNPMFGRKHSPETLAMMSRNRKGKTLMRAIDPRYPFYENKIEVLRRRTVRLIAKGWSLRMIAKHLGISRAAVTKLSKKEKQNE